MNSSRSDEVSDLFFLLEISMHATDGWFVVSVPNHSYELTCYAGFLSIACQMETGSKTMAQLVDSIFTEKATERLHSPEDLDAYVRVTNPSVWIALAACAILFAGLLSWGIFGTIATRVDTSGTYVDGEVVCFLSTKEASKVHVGDVANVNGTLMEVASLSAVPVSRSEAREIVESDYLVSSLVSEEWTYVVRFEEDGRYSFGEGVPLSVSITTERIAPISLIFG